MTPKAPAAAANAVTDLEGDLLKGLVEGRHVFYEDHDGTHAAIVAKVHPVYDGTPGKGGFPRGTVNLSVLAFDGTWYGVELIPFAPEKQQAADATEPTWLRCTWRWMFAGQGPHTLQPGAADPQYAK